MSYDTSKYEPGYGGRINSSGEVINIADVVQGGAVKVDVIGDESATSHQAWEGAVGTTATSFNPGVTMKELVFLSNDGTTDLFFSFDNKTVSTTPGTTGTSTDGILRLKANEVYSVLRTFSKINLIRASGSGAVRIVAL